jgi:hypothetical protein
MLSRALSLAAAAVIGCVVGTPVWAQNLDAGKSPIQIFNGNCSACHKSSRGLLKTVPPQSLPGFLRQHYTTGSEMAQMLSAYLLAGGGGAPAEPRAAGRHGRHEGATNLRSDAPIGTTATEAGAAGDKQRAERRPRGERPEIGRRPEPTRPDEATVSGERERPAAEAGAPARAKGKSKLGQRRKGESAATPEVATKPDAAKPDAAAGAKQETRPEIPAPSQRAIDAGVPVPEPVDLPPPTAADIKPEPGTAKASAPSAAEKPAEKSVEKPAVTDAAREPGKDAVKEADKPAQGAIPAPAPGASPAPSTNQ